MRLRAILACSVALAAPALAQPTAPPTTPAPAQPTSTTTLPPPTPPAPTPAPPPPDAAKPGDDAVLNEQIALSLVARAQELFEAKMYLDAKQLALEALVKSPRGQAADQARFVIKSVNTALGISDEPKPDKPPEKVDLTPIRDPLADKPTVEPLAEGKQAPQVRTILSGTVWGGIVGGLFADAVSVDSTTPTHVAIGAAIGAGVGGVGGYALARKVRLTRGDHALMDTLAGIGGAGGLTLGMLMQPAEGEAYSVNAVVGIASGLLVGYVAAPQTNTTERRMLRVAGMAAIGGALPFLLYAGIHDPSSTGDERLVGALSTAGLLAGAVVGFRLTRDLDVGKDVLPGEAKHDDDAPVSLIGRHSDGRWTANGIGISPLSPQLAPQHGMSINLLGGRF